MSPIPTTGHGLVYPDSTGNVNLWEHIQALADSTEAALDAYETFTPWTPTWTSGGFTSVGSGGLNEGFYQQIGSLVHAEFRIQLGTSPTVAAGTFQLALPVAAYVWGGTGVQATLGNWILRDDSAVTHYAGSIGLNNPGGGGTFDGVWSGSVPNGRVTNTVPITWAVSDVLSGVLTYRAA